MLFKDDKNLPHSFKNNKKKKERWTSFRILKSRIFGEEFPLSLSGNEPYYHT